MKKGSKKSDIEAKMSAKAWKDPKFKKKLLEDPKSALKEFGVEIPAKFKVKVIEEEQNGITYILQPAPQNLGEMDIDELEKIAGGRAEDPSDFCKMCGSLAF